LKSRERESFDDLLEEVLAELPPIIHELIEKVPLHVEDYPSAQMMAELGVDRREHLCGLYTGVPITERSIRHSGTLPDVVTIYREGILAEASDSWGRITPGRLRKEIRITIMHELAHYHGLDEDELRQLGYG
jgi:predicted Zn-dependent protease with MMP-like domain